MGTVLSVASECAPLVKTGGLADVAGALPAALAPLGWSMRTLLPAYPGLLDRLEDAREVHSWPALMGTPARLVEGRVGGLDVLLLDAPGFFERQGGIYLGPDGRDWPDNPQRFAALCHVAAHIAGGGMEGWKPDIVHLHDWQAAPTAMLLIGSGVPTITTIHNIAFQGLVSARMIGTLGFPPHHFTSDGYEYYGNVSFLKAGLAFSNVVTTVSPTYARELLTPAFGMGLEGVLRARGSSLRGILNGVDPDAWNPATDAAIDTPYDAQSVAAGKAANRKALEAEFGLEAGDGPIFGVVSRLTSQKGLDLLLDAMPALLHAGGRFVLIGSGEPRAERDWRAVEAAVPGRVGVFIGYDEARAHRFFAGADAVLVPSRFEPCGLTQLYGLRYGTVPIVARTGGLADTVIDANDAALRAGVATGFVHEQGASPAPAIMRACEIFAQPEAWARIRANGMAHPVDWSVSAREYAALYNGLTGSRA